MHARQVDIQFLRILQHCVRPSACVDEHTVVIDFDKSSETHSPMPRGSPTSIVERTVIVSERAQHEWTLPRSNLPRAPARLPPLRLPLLQKQCHSSTHAFGCADPRCSALPSRTESMALTPKAIPQIIKTSSSQYNSHRFPAGGFLQVAVSEAPGNENGCGIV